MIPARAALDRLQEGNRRFRSDLPGRALTNQARRGELVAGQEPFAIVVGCSDSRVPAEILFDAGLGDLFVIRVAGHVLGPSQLGSVEFAAENFGTRLVVVLGHSGCGAVEATLQEMKQPQQGLSPNLRALADCIRPGLEAVWETEATEDPDVLLRWAVRANIHAAVGQLRAASPVLARLIRADGLHVVGAEYSLATGAVEFLDELPLHD